MIVVLNINVKKDDVVRVRAWNEMIKDLRVKPSKTGLSIEERVPVGGEKYSFTRHMGSLFCGKKAKVTEVKPNGVIKLHFLGDTKPEEFKFREWMIERCE